MLLYSILKNIFIEFNYCFVKKGPILRVTNFSSVVIFDFAPNPCGNIFLNLYLYREATLRRVFRLFDRNNDGHIDREELKISTRELLGRQISGPQLDQLLYAMDRDHSGSIDYEEFIEGASKMLSLPDS